MTLKEGGEKGVLVVYGILVVAKQTQMDKWKDRNERMLEEVS